MYTTGGFSYNSNLNTRSKLHFGFIFLLGYQQVCSFQENQSLQLLVKKLQNRIDPPCSSITGNISNQPLNRKLLPHGKKKSIVVTHAFVKFKRGDPCHIIYVDFQLACKLVKYYPIPQLLLHTPFRTSYQNPHHFLP